MLIEIREYREVDKRRLMDVYSESNYQNTDYFFPDETDKELAVKKVEEEFLDFLKNDFFNQTGARYKILDT